VNVRVFPPLRARRHPSHGVRIGPVVPQIVAISTVPSIPSKLQNKIKMEQNRIEEAIFVY